MEDEVNKYNVTSSHVNPYSIEVLELTHAAVGGEDDKEWMVPGPLFVFIDSYRRCQLKFHEDTSFPRILGTKDCQGSICKMSSFKLEHE